MAGLLLGALQTARTGSVESTTNGALTAVPRDAVQLGLAYPAL
ncbi:hypothetical protein AWB74_07859 [Caballeronia arvi]|uniref:Uncharacterized protein n=1 Tax=Caballeronia arvi TaxID=1777135 RepID=A0A158L0E3_9BURK|nr:hypothetical protein AWB74_07859 [Caballeronia arvi]